MNFNDSVINYALHFDIFISVCMLKFMLGLLKLFNYFYVGEWMNSSAGIAFAPHVISIGVGEVCYTHSSFCFIYVFDVVALCIY